MRKTVFLSIVGLFCLVSFAAFAITAPTGDPILWVSGNITQTNSDQGAIFDRAMIDKLEHGSITTNNHVVEDVVEYTGPRLESLLDYVGAFGDSIKVIAWDDYIITISRDVIRKYDVLLATDEAGQRMTIDGKGPFFVVFPFADHAELRNDLYYSLSAWQVKEIIVE
ncbi:hypothetical protein TW81_16465 [Vibrio galatheae]|uniref:Oxidoreductase molybdopterin-binding domain-containing protein n=1 Tax=Vibrio galatheae TaxID=579748 RepID=A0A0F4NIR0_9VIBR|nr:hypothetical protein [Vibrio galatheae]KJY81941.1 hypothetical protein TW81_16465 [Vibrio galatheae]